MRRFWAKLLTAALVVSMLPVSVVCAEEDTFSGEELAEVDERVVSVSEGAVQERRTGGYVPMHWDNEVNMTDEKISWQQIKSNKVEGDAEVDGTDYTPRDESEIPAAFPCGADDAGLSEALAELPALRDQGNFGTCWAHSVIGCSEFYQMNKCDKDKNINLSELYLAYGIYKNQDLSAMPGKVLGEIDSELCDSELLDEGGNHWLAGQYLVKKHGFIDEEELEYSILDDADPQTVSFNLAIDINDYDDKINSRLTDMYVVDITDPDGAAIVKEAILQNGIVGISYYANSYYYYGGDNSYYCDQNPGANHAVAVVGWDDDFSFTGIDSVQPRPQNSGAWLVRNSWADGDTLGFNNYFWLSYEDKGLSSAAYIYDVTEDGNYDNCYYYDTQIHETYNLSGGGRISFANVYKVSDSSNEKLKEVVIETIANTDYKVEIYKNIKNSGEPKSGTLVSEATTSGALSLPGIYTIPLSEEVVLGKDSKFAVVVTAATESIAIEGPLDNYGASGGINVSTGSLAGQSFYKAGGEWADLKELINGNFCIDAHTMNTTEEEENKEEEQNKTSEEVVVKDANGNEVILTHDLIYNTYKTSDGKDVLMLSDADGKEGGTPKYQFTGKKITPAKKAYVVFNGILYEYKKDYGIGFKTNKNLGSAVAKVKWKKKSAPYLSGVKKSEMKFEVTARTVTEDMVSFSVKNGKLKKLRVTADGITMKPKKDDYSYAPVSDGFEITFKRNYSGVVTKKS